MMDQAVIKMDQLFQSALASGRLRADASLVLEPEVVEEEELEGEVEDLSVVDGAEPARQSLDDVVRSVLQEAEPARNSGAPTPPSPRP
jgi:hypothetical protein